MQSPRQPSCVMIGLLLGLSWSAVSAQQPSAGDSLARSARVAVANLRSAVGSADWARVSPYLPANSPWTSAVESQVSRRDTSGYSFWRRDSRLDDSLTVTVLGRDSVAIGAALHVGGHTGYWGAILRRHNGRWHLQCTSEQFGARTQHTAGCVSVRQKIGGHHAAPAASPRGARHN